MVYFKQDEKYARYLGELLDWTMALNKVLKEDEGEVREEADDKERQKLSLELEELMEEIKHCQVAIWHELKPDYIHQLYNRAVSLYEGLSIPRSSSEEERLSPVPRGGHKLPPLPYAYDALEPYISGEIMRLHHQKHHQSYVDGLNRAEVEMEKARRTGQFELLRHWEREASFNGSGHYLHTIFWNNMSPHGGGKPKGDLARQINQDFGSFEQFKQHFSEAARQVEGVGWALLVWSPRSHRLEILAAEKHQHFAQWDVIPLLVLDVWEHAYYLQYKNDRATYVKAWWNVVNWDDVEGRFQQARRLKWSPY